MRRRALTVALLTAIAALLTPGLAAAAKHGKKVKPRTQYYVSIGDSYAQGYQPGVTGPNRNGYAYQLPKIAAKRGYKLKLVNFGCGGATTESILKEKLKPGAKCLGPEAPKFSGTQAKAAEKFLKANRRDVALVTVSISGNDITSCAKQPDAVTCVAGAMPVVEKNIKTLLSGIRKAAGPKVRIVGITYPDVILGAWVGTNPNQDLAKLSVVAFEKLINPMLKKVYEQAGGRFVDVTAATGAYTPFEQLTDVAPYGSIPVAVAKVCDLTYYCELRDIHPKTAGYTVIANLIAATLPKRK